MSDRRTFSKRDKQSLYLLAHGTCQMCGNPLPSSWHADHKVPYSKDGATDLINGQALCPTCNLRKGNKMTSLPLWPSHVMLRDWQKRAFVQYNAIDKQNFMAVATPGAGKTMLALRIAHALLSEGIVYRIVILCPTSHLCIQWADKAGRVGIHLDPNFENHHGRPSSDYHGVVMTYQQVASNPWITHALCREVATLAVLDEPHHMGDTLQWGDKVQMALDSAARRLLITGTPFRSDNNPIPYVVYNADGFCDADFTYSYAEALRDSVCRPVIFPTYDGEMKWYSDGRRVQANFKDRLDRQADALRRLRAAISGDGEYLSDVFGYADAKLSEVRENGHPTAAGLVIAKDQEHAKKIARILEDVTEGPVSLAISEDAAADRIIKRFAADDCPVRWLVAVKMVSEGVDIPRLRVGVYATNVLTELFFRQVVGRFVRMQEGFEDQTSYLYLPADDVLVGYAQVIKEERQHQLQDELDRVRREREIAAASRVSDFTILDTSPARHHEDVYEGERMSAIEIYMARSVLRDAGLPVSVSDTQMALAMRKMESLGWIRPGMATRVHAASGAEADPKYIQNQDRRTIIKRLVAELHNVTGEGYGSIGAWLKGAVGGVSREKASLEQLDTQIDLLRKRLGYE